MTTVEARALKPCPFCGKLPEIDLPTKYNPRCYIHCENEDCMVWPGVMDDSGVDDGRAVAIAKWNTRA